MFYVSKRMVIAGSHKLELPYDSKCSNLHGHNWVITVFCKAEKLNESGMVADFKDFAEMEEYARKAHFRLGYEWIEIGNTVAGGLKYTHGLYPDQPLVKGAEVDRIINIYATFPDK